MHTKGKQPSKSDRSSKIGSCLKKFRPQQIFNTDMHDSGRGEVCVFMRRGHTTHGRIIINGTYPFILNRPKTTRRVFHSFACVCVCVSVCVWKGISPFLSPFLSLSTQFDMYGVRDGQECSRVVHVCPRHSFRLGCSTIVWIISNLKTSLHDTDDQTH